MSEPRFKIGVGYRDTETGFVGVAIAVVAGQVKLRVTRGLETLEQWFAEETLQTLTEFYGATGPAA